MELLLDDQQHLLREAAARLCASAGGPKRARRLRDASAGLDREAWGEIAAAGWLAMLVPEPAGGAGLGGYDLALAIEESGKQLLAAPLTEAAAAAWVLGAAPARAGEALAGVLDGMRVILPATRAPDWDFTATPTPRLDSDGTLTGEVPLVPFAATADAFVLDAVDGAGEAVLTLVERAGAGVTVDAAPAVDGSSAGRIALRRARPAAILARGVEAARLISGLRDLLVLGTATELLGVATAALDMTLAYIKFRQQFGRPIGSFQVLQHRAVDAFIDIETNRSLVYRALADRDAGRADPAIVSAVKARLSRTTLAGLRAALQMHGAIGYTDEHDIGLYHKHAVVLAARYGGEAQHLARFARLTAPSGEGEA
jgi:alkylation response protein AidB-like acyl-CoA dehydrogenase